jgi:uncharacterized RDD family membrane protein YckC
MNTQEPPRFAGLGRRLLAGIYDLLPILALWFAVAMVGVALNRGEALAGVPRALMLAASLAASTLYLAASWQRFGQTLGMRAWRLRLVDSEGHALGWRRALLRALCGLVQVAPLGAGLLTVPFDRERRSLADFACDTRVLRLPNRSGRPSQP